MTSSYANGSEIVYTIKEILIPEYDTTYETTEDGFNIINKHELGKGNGPEEEPPQTGIYVEKNNNKNVFVIIINILLLPLVVRRREI